MDVLALVNPDAGGWAAFVTIVAALVTSVARGWLVPRTTVDKLVKANELVAAVQAERLAESIARENEWRAMGLAERQRADLLASALNRGGDPA